ncbi:TRAP transporter substrate-binding protein [Jonquetella anthropi]|uniref:TRAP transporter substrate-binding protein n=1 Tax=Jonquetella anthropi TaxID=428712 RepID=UPI0001B911A3|nr:TRAP transporter substrate-binding protein [Jonquetella anthropi]EEX49214.1 TRAP transporter solute receptor, DctP family [Jonquetella anthropi E3_33 E1]
MKKLAALFFLTALAVPAFAADFPTSTIRFSHNQPVGSPEDMGAQKFKELVEKGSGGAITVEIFPHGQMGSMREQTEMVQMGTLEMSLQPSAVLTPFVEELKLIDFPFLWPSNEALYRVMDGPVGQELFDCALDKGFHVAGLWSGGFKQFTTKKVKIEHPSDFKGLKMRVMPSPLLIAQYKSWGANPVPIEYAELYNALQQDIVDGEENPIQSIALNKFYEVQGHLILSNHGFFPYILVTNRAWFDGLDDTTRKLVVDAERQARDYERALQKETENSYLDMIRQKSNIEISSLSEEGRKEFAEASRAVHSEFASTPKQKELLEKIYAALEEK